MPRPKKSQADKLRERISAKREHIEVFEQRAQEETVGSSVRKWLDDQVRRRNSELEKLESDLGANGAEK